MLLSDHFWLLMMKRMSSSKFATSQQCRCPLANFYDWQPKGQTTEVEIEEGCLNVIGFDWHVLHAPLHHWLSACLLNHCWFPLSGSPVTRVVCGHFSLERGGDRKQQVQCDPGDQTGTHVKDKRLERLKINWILSPLMRNLTSL